MAIWNIFPSKSGELMALFCKKFFEKSNFWGLVKFWKNLPIEKTFEWDVKDLFLIRVWNGKTSIPFV